MKRNINKEKSIGSLNKIRRTNAPPLEKKYINIPLPDELAKQIDSVIKTAELGYKTKSEFVKEAVREKLIELAKFKGFKKK